MNHQTDIRTTYMGLNLPSPVLASSSDFTSNTDSIVKLAQAGAGAVVLKSLFEEQIMMETDAMRMNNMFGTYSYNEEYIAYYTKQHEVKKYLDLISDAKRNVQIPVIASIHCSSADSWMRFAAEIERAGADGLELNVFVMPSDASVKEQQIKSVYHSIVDGVRAHTKLPLALKLHWYFTDMAAFMTELSEKVDALVLFNRFYNPDIDIATKKIVSRGSLSQASDHAQIMRWIGVLAGRISSGLSASGGIHDAEAVIKSLLAGTDVVQVASAIYQKNESAIADMVEGLQQWMAANHFGSLSDFRGSLSQKNIANPMLYERAQFMKYFSDYQQTKEKS